MGLRIHTVAGVLLGAVVVSAATGAQAQTPTNEELYNIIQQQQREIEALRKDRGPAVTRGAASGKHTPIEAKVEAQQQQIEALADRDAARSSVLDRVTIGGYGELHYNNLDAKNPDNDLDQIDFHRFVLLFGYDFTDNLSFRSEVEFEHAFTSGDDESPGAVELEQAYLQYDFNNSSSALAGQFLAPLGILNETHEPPTFYGVERNDVENIIIPTTYRVGGVQFSQRFGQGFQADLSIHEGLAVPTDGDSAFRVRSGRQSTAEAVARDLAYSIGLKYTGIPGVELGGAVQYEQDPSQAGDDSLDDGVLWEVHTDIQRGIFGFRALYAAWDFSIDESQALAAGVPTAQIERAGDQHGWYVEPSVRPFEKVGFYTRYEDIEGARAQDVFDQWEIGVNYWPHPDVVFKIDYRDRSLDLASESGRGFTGFDLGMGYQF
jgi:hypothetical protein